MELTIYAKKRTTNAGKVFFNYLTTLKRKDGEEQTLSVKFRDECGTPRPETCPCNIIVDKADANIAKRTFTREDTGLKDTALTLWISAWKMGSVFVDTSLDDYEL